RSDSPDSRQVKLDRASLRALPYDQVELEVFHRRIQRFLDRSRQAMHLVDEQDVALLQRGEDGGEVTGVAQDGPGGGADGDAHFPGDDVGNRGLADARGAVEHAVVERLLA